jgi:hypothetical protein
MANETTAKMVIHSGNDIPVEWIDVQSLFESQKAHWAFAYRWNSDTTLDEGMKHPSFQKEIEQARSTMYYAMRQMAVDSGVEDRCYDTVARGAVSSYRGEAEVEWQGKRFLAKGVPSSGTPEYLASRGTIYFVEV